MGRQGLPLLVCTSTPITALRMPGRQRARKTQLVYVSPKMVTSEAFWQLWIDPRSRENVNALIVDRAYCTDHSLYISSSRKHTSRRILCLKNNAQAAAELGAKVRRLCTLLDFVLRSWRSRESADLTIDGTVDETPRWNSRKFSKPSSKFSPSP